MKGQVLFSLFLTTLTATAQVDTLDQRLILIGDAGELLGTKQPVVEWVKKHVDLNDEKNTVIYLGDNIYPLGLPMEGEPTYAEAKRILDEQINLVMGKKARAFFVLGNHDWKNGKLGGWQQALNQQAYINRLEKENIAVHPTEGCPGPYAVELSNKVLGVFIDSQWFLYVHEKPGPGSNCAAKTIDEFTTELREIALSHPNHLMVVIMHHPMYTFGPHGKNYSWKEHLFPLTALKPKLYIPLPVIGSIYPIARGVFGSLQDIPHPLYRNMVDVIEGVLKEHPNAIHVAGHEHMLQLIMKDAVPYIVSGSAINRSRVKENREGSLLFSHVQQNGLAILEVRKSGAVEVKFYNVNSPSLDQPLYARAMDSVRNIPAVVSKDSIPRLPDSITVIANKDLEAGWLKRLFMGRNYRAEWTTPLRVPVLDMGKEQGGLVPEKQGGGKQTRTLRVEDKSGKEWSLRSIQKFPEAAIPPDLRSPAAVDLVEDGISASYPFASLSIAPLARAAGVPTLRRKLVYIPDDPRLGRFRETFRNTLAVMEERETPGVKKTYNTDEVVVRMAKDNDDKVDQHQVLRARLLDNFYMDFDRHEGQWEWATRDTGKGKIYYAIPKDQDQAFYTNQGIIPRFARQPSLVPEIQGIRPKARSITTFNKPARNFDRFFLNDLDQREWGLQIDTLLSGLTDAVIDSAMGQQPREVRGFSATKLAKILKKRREHFRKDMMKYYRFLSKEVNIVGSNQRELFTITGREGGETQVTIHKIDKEGKVSSLIYDRVFDPSHTKELRIYGLEDADSFHIAGARSPIHLRIIGGPGKDHFVNAAPEGKAEVYDVVYEENSFEGNLGGLRQRLSKDPRNNQYTRIFYKYNIFDPGLLAAYNVDDGLFLGLRLRYTSHGFRKEPYAMQQSLAAGRALRTNSMFFRYTGDVTKLFGNTGLMIRADVRAPINVTNFFGLGNETTFDPVNDDNVRYFRTRYNVVNASALLRRQLQSWMRVMVGPTFQYFKLPREQNLDKFVNNTTINGLDAATLYEAKTYLGAELAIDINSKNNQVLPTRGFTLDAGIRRLYGMNKQSFNVTQVRWDMSLFLSLVPQSPYVLATRFGWYKNYGNFTFQQAAYLSGPDNLRGYRRNRFAGRSMLFNNTEFRLRLGHFNTYLFPGSIGLLVFNDVGRVFTDGERSQKWHVGYGGGIWIAPIQRFVITASVARSEEEKLLPYFTLGFQF
jgi:hypothetical protein